MVLRSLGLALGEGRLVRPLPFQNIQGFHSLSVRRRGLLQGFVLLIQLRTQSFGLFDGLFCFLQLLDDGVRLGAGRMGFFGVDKIGRPIVVTGIGKIDEAGLFSVIDEDRYW